MSGFPDWFDAFSHREDGPEVIKSLIEAYLSIYPDCSVVVIDGLLDLLIDFNDVSESRNLINWLKRISKIYNCLIVTVLHLGKKDMNTLGHLGSMCDRYSQSTLKIERDKERNCFTLSPSFLRSSADFDPVHIAYTGDGWHELTSQDLPIEKQKEKILKAANRYNDTEVLNSILINPLSYRDLATMVSEYTGIGINKAKAMVSKWVMTNQVVKEGNLYKKNNGS
jgi:hypothetical protein